MDCTAGVPSSCLVWPRNCGSGTTTCRAATSPSCASSRPARSPERASFLEPSSSTSFTARVSARSKPARCVPPAGVGMVFTKLATLLR